MVSTVASFLHICWFDWSVQHTAHAADFHGSTLSLSHVIPNPEPRER